jgi:prepilin-type N-terminal cleavage/methylation domain-containing protein
MRESCRLFRAEGLALRDRRKNPGRRFNQGFSLVEFLVVLTIIGVVAAISIAAFNEWIDTYRLNRDAKVLASEMTMARFRAVSARQDISFTISSGSGYVASYRFSPGGLEKHLSRSVTLSAVIGDNPVVFNSRGMASNDTTITLINDSGTTSTVNVNIVGLVQFTRGF